MKKVKVLASSLAAILILAVFFPATADADGFYVTAEIGGHFVDETFDIDTVSARIDDRGSAWRVGAGYELTDWFSVEVGHVDFGSIRSSAFGIDLGASADGQEVSLIGRLPLGDNFSVNLRGGYMWWNGKATAGPLSNRLSDRDVGLGLGLEYSGSDKLVFGVNVRTYELEDLETVLASFGIRYRF